MIEFAVFETAIGWAALAWSARGIKRAWLPEPDAEAMRERVRRRVPEAIEADPPKPIESAIDGIQRLFKGEAVDLTGIDLDLEGLSEFNRRVYAVARSIPPGGTLTYGEIAARIGESKATREVGQALGENPIPIIVPCHRVLGANGKLGGFSAPGGATTKARLLTIEGAKTSEAPMLFDRLPIAARPRG